MLDSKSENKIGEREKANVLENIVLSLPEWKKIFLLTPSFSDLFYALINLLESDNEEDRYIKQLELQHCKDIFDNLCESDPEGLKEKNRLEEQKRIEKKEERMKMLFAKHIKSMQEPI